MHKFKIYLSGGMQKFGKENFEESNLWREVCKHWFCTFCDNAEIFNPNDYFNFKNIESENLSFKDNLRIMKFDLYNLKKADLVIVNFNDKYSLGTQSEITVAYDRGIPIIGISDAESDLHPWQICMCENIFPTIPMACEYVKDFYIY